MLLLAAELERLRGRADKGIDLYQKAAESAETHGFVHLQALVAERLARYVEVYLDQHTEARFSHGLCPDCFGEIASDFGISRFTSPESI